MFARLTRYIRESSQEMQRVSWPSRPELKESTIVVIVTVLIVTVLVFLVDKVFDFTLKGILSVG